MQSADMLEVFRRLSKKHQEQHGYVIENEKEEIEGATEDERSDEVCT